eukprot:6321201-Prymnesium_polylepis.1
MEAGCWSNPAQPNVFQGSTTASAVGDSSHRYCGIVHELWRAYTNSSRSMMSTHSVTIMGRKRWYIFGCWWRTSACTTEQPSCRAISAPLSWLASSISTN